MNPNQIIYIDNLIEDLVCLASLEFQKEAWFNRGQKFPISSFSEDVCRVFDDDGVSSMLKKPKDSCFYFCLIGKEEAPGKGILEKGILEDVLSKELVNEFNQLSIAIDKVDMGLGPDRLLVETRVEAVRQVARKILLKMPSRFMKLISGEYRKYLPGLSL